jgi:hypothetical protein
MVVMAVLGLARVITITPARQRIETAAHDALRRALVGDSYGALERLLALRRAIADGTLDGLARAEHERLLASLDALREHSPRVDSSPAA